MCVADGDSLLASAAIVSNPPRQQLNVHDEGSCWIPRPMKNAIILSHWGRRDANHTSYAGAGEDLPTWLRCWWVVIPMALVHVGAATGLPCSWAPTGMPVKLGS